MPDDARLDELLEPMETLGRDWPNLIVFSIPDPEREVDQLDRVLRIELDSVLTAGEWQAVKGRLQGNDADREQAAKSILLARARVGNDKPSVPQLIRLALSPDSSFPCSHPGQPQPDPQGPDVQPLPGPAAPPKARIDIVEDFAQNPSPPALVRLILDVPFDPAKTKTVEEVELLLKNKDPALKDFVVQQAQNPAPHERRIIDAFLP